MGDNNPTFNNATGGKLVLDAIISSFTGNLAVKDEWISSARKSAEDIADSGIATMYQNSFIASTVKNHAKLSTSELKKAEEKAWKAADPAIQTMMGQAREKWLNSISLSSDLAEKCNMKGKIALSAQVLAEKGLINDEWKAKIIEFSELPYPTRKIKKSEEEEDEEEEE